MAAIKNKRRPFNKSFFWKKEKTKSIVEKRAMVLMMIETDVKGYLDKKYGLIESKGDFRTMLTGPATESKT